MCSRGVNFYMTKKKHFPMNGLVTNVEIIILRVIKQCCMKIDVRSRVLARDEEDGQDGGGESVRALPCNHFCCGL
jgi:hypothetical protein